MDAPSTNLPLAGLPTLTALSPKYKAEHHELYVDLIVRELDDEESTVRNLALTGAYGGGKSSILREVARRYGARVVEISLSTLAPAPKLGTASTDPDSDQGDRSNPAAASTTNRIQKEVVKQLLYRLAPQRTPHSGFPRASRPSPVREGSLATAIGAFVVGALLVLGLPQRWVDPFSTQNWRVLIAYALLVVAAVALPWFVIHHIRGRDVSSLSAGSASITLSKSAASYFDQYLDEIVYFFDVSKCDIVLIEDIDRFEDAHIFETLRSLNILLNQAGQLKKRRIVFIYAIRDSVFDTIGKNDELFRDPEEAEETPDSEAPARADLAQRQLSRVNRTKFFDMVIPVVPFITHNNARDLMSSTLIGADYTISRDLVALTARHVADMRLIHNIKNEFEIFRRRLLAVPTPMPGLSVDQLFAIVLFKNTHAEDFEKIRLRRSTLDTLHRHWRRLVRTNLTTRSDQLTTCRNERSWSETRDGRAQHLGNRLIDALAFLSTSNPPLAGHTEPRFEFESRVLNEDAVRSPEFWRELANGAKVKLGPFRQSYFALDLAGVARLIGEPIHENGWELTDLGEVSARIASAEADLNFLRHHEWADLYTRPEFLLAVDDAPSARSFADLTTSVLTSRLARDLVKHGYLNQHFALYVSAFYGQHLPPRAMDYLMRCIEPGKPDADAELDGDDVDAILRAQSSDILRDPSILNTQVLDHLLLARPADAAQLVRQMTDGSGAGREFLDTYFRDGTARHDLVVLLASTWPGVFVYLASSPPTDEASTLELFDHALAHTTGAVSYILGAPVRAFIELHQRDLRSVTDPGTEPLAQAVHAMIAEASATLDSVDLLDDDSRKASMAHATYRLTAANLTALSGSQDLALDVLRDADPDRALYRRALTSPRAYLAAVQSSPTTPHTVVDPGTFVDIVNDLEEAAARDRDEILTLAHEGCIAPDLGIVHAGAWPVLCATRRTSATFQNVHRYMGWYGIDEHLAKLLRSSQTIGWEMHIDGDEERTEVARQLLDAHQLLPDPPQRVRLAQSLHPARLPAAKIAPEAGAVVGLLIRSGLVADDANVFSERLMVDWPTWEATIAASATFADLVDPELFPGAYLTRLLRSSVVPARAKRAVVEALPKYLEIAPRDETAHLSRALAAGRWHLSAEVIERLAICGGHPESIIELLSIANRDVPREVLLRVLIAIDEPYSNLAQRGYWRGAVRDNGAHRALLDRLRAEGIVSRHRPDDERAGIRYVTLRRP